VKKDILLGSVKERYLLGQRKRFFWAMRRKGFLLGSERDSSGATKKGFF